MRYEKQEGSPSRIVHQAGHHLQKHLALGLKPSHRSCISPPQEKRPHLTLLTTIQSCLPHLISASLVPTNLGF
jgi:hypothetical protein